MPKERTQEEAAQKLTLDIMRTYIQIESLPESERPFYYGKIEGLLESLAVYSVDYLISLPEKIKEDPNFTFPDTLIWFDGSKKRKSKGLYPLSF